MNMENRALFIDEPVEFEEYKLKLKTSWKLLIILDEFWLPILEYLMLDYARKKD